MAGELVCTEAAEKPRPRGAHAWLSPAAYELLERAAAARSEHPDRLAARILDHVLCDGLIHAVVD